ncbi:hypothetical protein [Paenibacillus naphthalenovorans]|uniref:hypothetical protein n=1 Tax=Paenibacillus naphthalenovorans TaxID=162209 RepID=UPI001113709B|nr:hypothetical protein [Paenibacillus naphthalenovorans]
MAGGTEATPIFDKGECRSRFDRWPTHDSVPYARTWGTWADENPGGNRYGVATIRQLAGSDQRSEPRTCIRWGSLAPHYQTT